MKAAKYEEGADSGVNKDDGSICIGPLLTKSKIKQVTRKSKRGKKEG